MFNKDKTKVVYRTPGADVRCDGKHHWIVPAEATPYRAHECRCNKSKNKVLR